MFVLSRNVRYDEKGKEWIYMNIGLIGTGSIGNFLLQKINKEKRLPGCQITAVFDEREKAKMTLPRLLNTYRFTAFHDVEAFLKSDVDIVVECANIEVVRSYAAQIVQEKDLLLISVGALADITLYKNLKPMPKRMAIKYICLPAQSVDWMRYGQRKSGADYEGSPWKPGNRQTLYRISHSPKRLSFLKARPKRRFTDSRKMPMSPSFSL